MDLTAILLIITLAVEQVFTGLNPYVGEDGLTYYSTPLPCIRSGILQSAAYNNKTSTFTWRNDVKCCTLAATRNSCCLDSTTNQCKCDPKIACGDTTTTAATSTPQTRAPVPTTESTTELTTEHTTTTTTTPSTTTTTPSTTTTTPTTTSTTTTAPTTTTPYQSLCTKPSFRVLNGQVVTNDCPYPGVSNILEVVRNASVCNAAFTIATVNGETKPTFLTSSTCKSIIESGIANGRKYDIQIGVQRYAIDNSTFLLFAGPNGTAFIDVKKEYIHILDFLGACQKASCPFNNNTMNGLVNFNNCKVLSYGCSYANLTRNGLNEAAISLSPTGCTSIPDATNVSNTMCFTSTSGKNLYCGGDQGAPVYCSTYSLMEWILMGVTMFMSKSNTYPDIKVLPYPG